MTNLDPGEGRPRHLVAVWNPMYVADSIDSHVAVLGQQADRAWKMCGGDPETMDWDGVFVWWGSIQSVNRMQAHPHLELIVDLQKQINAGVETYMYLTDYSSLYVAHVAEVSARDPREADDRTAIPAYYISGRHDVLAWYRVRDIRRLVAEDTIGVMEELRNLRVVTYGDKPVSLFGGIVDPPLLTWREKDVDWFANREKLAETGLSSSGDRPRLWADLDAELRGEVGKVSKDLRDNLFGRECWSRFDSATRSFLAAGEAVYRNRREDPVFDFSGPAMEYFKAVEVELNTLLFDAVRPVAGEMPPDKRSVKSEGGRSLDLSGRVEHQTLGSLLVLLDNRRVKDLLEKALHARGRPLLESNSHLSLALKGLRHDRNKAAHGEGVSAARIYKVRRDVMGIGCHGVLVQLASLKRSSNAT